MTAGWLLHLIFLNMQRTIKEMFKRKEQIEESVVKQKVRRNEEEDSDVSAGPSTGTNNIDNDNVNDN